MDKIRSLNTLRKYSAHISAVNEWRMLVYVLATRLHYCPSSMKSMYILREGFGHKIISSGLWPAWNQIVSNDLFEVLFDLIKQINFSKSPVVFWVMIPCSQVTDILEEHNKSTFQAKSTFYPGRGTWISQENILLASSELKVGFIQNMKEVSLLFASCCILLYM